MRATTLLRASSGCGVLVTQPLATSWATVPDMVGWEVESADASAETPAGPSSSSSESTRSPAGASCSRRISRTSREAYTVRSSASFEMVTPPYYIGNLCNLAMA